jgi:hypothetical protein
MELSMFSLILDNADSEDVLSFFQWLEGDPEFNRTTTLDLSEESGRPPGAMGAVFDVISLAITSGFSAANLAIAFSSWKASRDVNTSLIIRRGSNQVVISGDDQKDIAAVDRYFSSNEESR